MEINHDQPNPGENELPQQEEFLKQVENQPLFCPIPKHPDFVPADPALMDPLLAYLESEPGPDQQRAFPSGTLIPPMGDQSGHRLDMCKQSIGAAGAARLFKALESNGYVESILLGTNGLGDPGALALAEHVRKNPSLKTLYLGCNRFSSHGVTQLAEALKDSTSIRSLWLKRNRLGIKGARAIAGLIEVNPHIRTLDLVHTLIGREGLGRLTNAITHADCRVETLMLGGNYFYREEGVFFRRMLEEAPFLKSLFIDVNYLGPEGVFVVAIGWEKRPDVLALGLASNGMGTKGVTELAGRMPSESQLRILDLGYRRSSRVLGAQSNGINDAGVPALCELVNGLKQLQILDLSGNRLSEKGAWELTEALEGNHSIVRMPLNKGLSVHLRRKVRALLERNMAAQGQYPKAVSPDFEVIRSVYR